MSHELTLFGIGTSRTMRAHWILLELGLDYESHPIQPRTGETLTEQFRRLNPRHKIPVLQHKSFVLTDSTAIVQLSLPKISSEREFEQLQELITELGREVNRRDLT